MLAAGLVAAVVIGTVSDRGRPSARVSLSTGSAWFPSPDAGSVALIDGTTVTRVVQVPVFSAGDRIETVQAGSSAYVLDHSRGQAVQVDGSSLTAGSPVILGQPGDSRLSLASTGGITWAIERNGTVAQQLDPRTLFPLGPPIAFPGNAAAPVLGSDGTLWLTGGGLVRSLRGSKVRTSVQIGSEGGAQMVMASGRPVVLDPATHRAIEISPASGRPVRSSCFDSTDPRVLISGSQSGGPKAFAVSSRTGTLLISNLQTGTCREVLLGDQARVDRYGLGVESGGDIYIPDYLAGTVIVVDTGSGAVLGRPRIERTGAHFQLLGYHGFVWFDDTRADLAGIVTLHGAVAVNTSRGDPKGRKVDLNRAIPEDLPPAPPRSPDAPVGTAPSHSIPTTQAGTPLPANPSSPPSPAASVPPIAASPTTSPTTPSSPKPPVSIVPVKPSPSFTYSPNPGVVGNAVRFTNTTPGPLSITGWTFAGGSPAVSTSADPVVTWSAFGTYTVTLTVARSGSAASISRQVQIVGANDVTVPDVTGDTVAQARQVLAAKHLTVGSTSKHVFSFIARGDVANTTPAANASVPEGTPVNLNISEETGKIGTYGPAGTAFGAPARLTIDSAGNLYVADCAKNKVFKESMSGSLLSLTTVAGTGVAGNSDGTGFATGAELDCPIATALDPSGILYIADKTTSDLRAVDLHLGEIRTVTPDFKDPLDLNFHDGTLYAVGGPNNCTVDTVDPEGGIVTPVVGTEGTCADSGSTLSDPSSVTFNAAGDMYITEPGANIVRKFPHAGGPLVTVAGTGTKGFAGDGGAATSARLNSPDDVAFDTRGDYFITDAGNDVVREITPDGRIQTIAGTPGVCGYSGDGGAANAAKMCTGGNASFLSGIAIDGAGNLYISDTNNHAIRAVFNFG
jgi:sugar lactone lactonase YvrE